MLYRGTIYYKVMRLNPVHNLQKVHHDINLSQINDSNDDERTFKINRRHTQSSLESEMIFSVMKKILDGYGCTKRRLISHTISATGIRV